MPKLIFTITSTLLLLTTALASTSTTLNTSGGNSWMMTYVTPDAQANEALRVRFDLTLAQVLGYNKVATVICIQTENSAYTMSEGATKSAFGVSFA